MDLNTDLGTAIVLCTGIVYIVPRLYDYVCKISGFPPYINSDNESIEDDDDDISDLYDELLEEENCIPDLLMVKLNPIKENDPYFSQYKDKQFIVLGKPYEGHYWLYNLTDKCFVDGMVHGNDFIIIEP